VNSTALIPLSVRSTEAVARSLPLQWPVGRRFRRFGVSSLHQAGSVPQAGSADGLRLHSEFLLPIVNRRQKADRRADILYSEIAIPFNLILNSTISERAVDLVSIHAGPPRSPQLSDKNSGRVESFKPEFIRCGLQKAV